MIKKQTTTARGIWCNLLSRQNEAISLVAMRSKELWLVQEYHATVKLDSNGFSRNENLQRKQNSNPQIVRKILEKSSQILSSEQPWILQELKEHDFYAWSWLTRAAPSSTITHWSREYIIWLLNRTLSPHIIQPPFSVIVLYFVSRKIPESFFVVQLSGELIFSVFSILLPCGCHICA